MFETLPRFPTIATLLVTTQVITIALLWSLDPLLLPSQREIGIFLAVNPMMCASVLYLYLASRKVLTLNAQ